MIDDRTADRVLELATRGSPPAAIAAELAIELDAVYAAIGERPSATCAVCCLRVRASASRRVRWHVARVGEVEPCPGSGRRAARSTGAEIGRLVRAARAKKQEAT